MIVSNFAAVYLGTILHTRCHFQPRVKLEAREGAEHEIGGFDYGVVGYPRLPPPPHPEKQATGLKASLSLYSYANDAPKAEGYLTAKYAYGRDYRYCHQKKKLEEIAETLGGFEKYEAMTDISYLDEKLCAVLAGLGRIGKNNLLLTPKYGSRVLIGEIVTSVVFPKTESELPNPCIDCFLCVKNCPTDASERLHKKVLVPSVGLKTKQIRNSMKKWSFGVAVMSARTSVP